MRVLLDELECDVTARTVGEAIAAGATLAEEGGRMIIEVIVDGARLEESELSTKEQIEREASEVRLLTANPMALADDTLGDAIATLEEIDARQRRAAELVQADDGTAAMGLLAEALQMWHAVHQAVSLTSRMLEMDLETIELSTMTGLGVIEEWSERMIAVKTALTDGDPIGLSDTLLYELPETVDRWRELLERIRESTRGDEDGE